MKIVYMKALVQINTTQIPTIVSYGAMFTFLSHDSH
eukprot:CAMPEP_0113393330 /NCGR_PEP_ID=MMETSP0013_2-20120614/11816_1 /TAXON_ID=2843 ORGANISM="Skeletonema costatum, Strain 1716" /NCGR_SAMPLE_ID=MMETSP0013_2 /ASSEMBLY_ACC=CAM_ASM_000158 /LENGTH=35 /DNA_ID=CAMNT_0000276893 /DNA_START=86 /DNA_END=193 /DNA_ORIENTATION=- /assembly_acc=CAM_ASM_000158